MNRLSSFQRNSLATGPLEIARVQRRELNRWSYFPDLNRIVRDCIDVKCQDAAGVSYAIWGGMAANIFLGLTGHCSTYFCLHDIELFLTRSHAIHLNSAAAAALSCRLEADKDFLISVGGLPIVQSMDGVSLEEFQVLRLRRDDGDLLLNSIVLELDVEQQQDRFLLPVGLAERFSVDKPVIEVKEHVDLNDVPRLVRRYYRSAAKLIRYEWASDARASPQTLIALEQVATAVKLLLENHFSRSRTLQREDPTGAWCAAHGLRDLASARSWLYAKTLAEVAKRVAGLDGVSSQDESGFYRFLDGCNSRAMRFADHPLVRLVAPERKVRNDGFRRGCYLEFESYQKPSAELLPQKHRLLCRRLSSPGSEAASKMGAAW